MAPRQSHERLRLLSHGMATTSSTPAQAGTDSAVSLPNDLIFDILSRLPVRSLCRFRCASTEWRALISDATFLAAHKSRHAEALVCLAAYFRERKLCYELRLMDMDGSVMRVIEGIFRTELLSTSMDDLVCCSNYFTGDTLVVDPAKGEVLAHCPEKEIRTVGFGRAVPSGVYKVVGVRLDQTCYVFTPGDDTRWRWSQSPATHMRCIRRPPVAINGIMYFWVSRELDNVILRCFDIEKEEWKNTIEGPRKATGTDMWKITDPVRIAEFDDTLCFVHSETSNENNRVNIWVLTGTDKNTWTKAYTIRVPSSTYQYIPSRMTHDGGKLRFLRFGSGVGYELCVYDPRTETFTTFHTLGTGICRIALCSMQLDRFVSGPRQRPS